MSRGFTSPFPIHGSFSCSMNILIIRLIDQIMSFHGTAEDSNILVSAMLRKNKSLHYDSKILPDTFWTIPYLLVSNIDNSEVLRIRT